MHAGGQSAGVAVVGERGVAVPVLLLIGRDQLSGIHPRAGPDTTHISVLSSAVR